MIRSLRVTLARIGRWPRLAAAGICLMLAALSALGPAHRPRPTAAAAPGVRVVVAARDLPVGHRLVPADLAVARWPAPLVPATARATPAAFAGSTLAVPVARREPLTAARVIGPGLLAGLPSGAVGTVVAVDRDVGAFVRAGDRIGLLAARRTDPADPAAVGTDGAAPGRSAGAAEIARHVLVVAVVPGSATDDAVSISLVLAVDPALARRVVGLEPTWTFSAVRESP